MNYPELWHRLTGLYDDGEAKAVVRWLLDAGFGLSAADVYGGRLEQMDQAGQQRVEAAMRRLEQGEPVQYVVGMADFCGRPFGVGPGVLIPRPETAELCRLIVAENTPADAAGGAAGAPAAPRILDIGTGSGCIAVTLALDLPGSAVTAWDISADALRRAAENAAKLGATITLEQRDMLAMQPTEPAATPCPWDIIVSNPPYISEQERDGMAKNVLDYEPHTALFGPSHDPALFYKRIGEYAAQQLRPGGQLWFELNPLSADEVVHYLRALGFSTVETLPDQAGRQRFLKAYQKT